MASLDRTTAPGPPRPWSWPIYAQSAPAFSTPSRRKEGAPRPVPRGLGSSARTQHQDSPGVFPEAPTPVSQSSPAREPAQLVSAAGTDPSSLGPPYLVMAQSEVRGGDAGESNRDESKCDR